MTFILNPDGETIHAENPLAECNVPTARKRGKQKGTTSVSFAGAAAAWARGYRPCTHCIGTNADDDGAGSG